MHPFFSDPKRLAGYLVFWSLIAGLFAVILSLTNAIPWQQALAIAGPPTLLFSFECLASWFLCRAMPLRANTFARTLASHGVIAASSGIVWVGIAAAWVRLLTSAEIFPAVSWNILHLPWWVGAASGLYLLSVASFYVLISFESSQRAEQEALTSRMLAQEAELRFLRTQIDPHFLFNSLNSISALTSNDAAAAREMTVLLGDFLRASLHLGGEQEISVAQEIELLRKFLGIERVRFGSRLRTSFNVDPDTNFCTLPPLLIQPLVENAVKHGVATLVDGGSIAVSASRNGAFFSVRIENEFDPDAAPALASGVGLVNVRRRVESLYGNDGRVTTRSEGGTFTVEITLPVKPR